MRLGKSEGTLFDKVLIHLNRSLAIASSLFGAVVFGGLRIPHLLERECRILAAQLKAPASLRRAGYLAIAGTILIALLDRLIRFRNPGNFLFLALFLPIIVVLLNAGSGLSSALVEHRRSQMMGLLFLTHARPRDFFLAQIGARIVAAFYLALALLPCFAVSLLYGGIHWQRCVAAALFLILEVIFVVAFEFVGAAITADSGLAGLISNIARGVLVFWPWVIDRIAQIFSGRPLPHGIYLFSPLQAGLRIFYDFGNAADFHEFFLCFIAVAAVSLAALLISSWILAHTWREEDHPLKRFRIIRESLNLIRRSQRNWAAQLRFELERNPLAWQAAFDQSSVRVGWISLAVLGALWVVGLSAFGKSWAVPGIFYLAAAAFIYAVRLQMLLRIATRFSEGRQNHYFDFLLASGHTPEEIVAAEKRGLYLQFGAITWTVRALTLAFMIAPLYTRDWNSLALCEHLIISVFILWVSALRPHAAITQTMWVSLNTGFGVSAVFRKSSFPLANFAFQFYRIISRGLSGLSKYPTGSEMGVAITLIAAVFVAVIILVHEVTAKSRHAKLTDRFREILQSPLRPAGELAKWDQETPLT